MITARECGNTGDPVVRKFRTRPFFVVLVVVDSVGTNKLIKRDNKSLVFMWVNNGKEGSAFGAVLHDYKCCWRDSAGPPVARGEVAV